MKKLLKILLILILVIVAALAALLGWLTATEFNPAPVEAAAITRAGDNDTLHGGDRLTVLSWNIGFGGLGKAEDSFLDGGTKAKPDSRDVVYSYLDGIAKTIAENEPDLVLLQEVDVDSARTYGIDERGCLDSGMSCDTFALNYSCPFVPVPVPPMGKVNSGLFTMTDDLLIERAEHVPIPAPSPGRCASPTSSAACWSATCPSRAATASSCSSTSTSRPTARTRASSPK